MRMGLTRICSGSGRILYQLAADHVTVSDLSDLSAEKMKQYLDFLNRYCAQSVQKPGSIEAYPTMEEM